MVICTLVRRAGHLYVSPNLSLNILKTSVSRHLSLIWGIWFSVLVIQYLLWYSMPIVWSDFSHEGNAKYIHPVYWIISFSLPTDPTFTLNNVTTAVESVENWYALGIYLGVLSRKCTSRKKMLQYFIATVPDASWQTLAGKLYYLEEHAALERAIKYFQPQPGIWVGRSQKYILMVWEMQALNSCSLTRW